MHNPLAAEMFAQLALLYQDATRGRLPEPGLLRVVEATLSR